MPPYGNQGSFPDFPRQPLPPNSSSSNSTASRSAQARHGPPPGAVPVQPPGPPGNLTPLPPNQSQPPPGTFIFTKKIVELCLHLFSLF